MIDPNRSRQPADRRLIIDEAAMFESAASPEAISGTLHASDAALVARAQSGDAAAFEAIMRRHNRLLFRTARGIVGDDDEAQDIVQETYLRAFSALTGFRADAALGTWLARIAINVALDLQRRRGRVVRFDDLPDASGEYPTEAAMPIHATGGEAPDVAAAAAQSLRLLQAAIDSLPPIYRSVFILRAVEELSVEQTAACLGVSGDVVKTRYLRARSMLRDALGARIESEAQSAYAFAGARCDAVVANVLADLQRRGVIGPG